MSDTGRPVHQIVDRILDSLERLEKQLELLEKIIDREPGNQDEPYEEARGPDSLPRQTLRTSEHTLDSYPKYPLDWPPGASFISDAQSHLRSGEDDA